VASAHAGVITLVPGHLRGPKHWHRPTRYRLRRRRRLVEAPEHPPSRRSRRSPTACRQSVRRCVSPRAPRVAA